MPSMPVPDPLSGAKRSRRRRATTTHPSPRPGSADLSVVDADRLLAEGLADLARRRSDFLANAHHQLRTPLTSVVGWTEVLLSGDAGPLSAEQVQMLERVESNGVLLLELVENLLDRALDCPVV